MSHDTLIKPHERELIFKLAHDLTGISTQNNSRYEVVVLNVARRIRATGCQDFQGYLQYITDHEKELGYLISSLTIHTTNWFRELPHYRNFERELTGICAKQEPRKYRLLSAACSSGEELYSFGMVLESFRKRFRGFDYELMGVDVDPISVHRAESGVYRLEDLSGIPQQYRRFLLPRPKAGPGHYVIDPEIRRRTSFEVGNLADPMAGKYELFDQVVCRNVLIYFQKEQVDEIIANLLELLTTRGRLTLGHCEMIDGRTFDLECLGNCTYQRISQKPRRSEDKSTVLVVDDSKAIRLWLTTVLEEAGLQVMAVESAEEATEYLARHSVDLITLDLNLPGQYGLNWLTDQRRMGVAVPVIVFTDVNAQEAPHVLDALSGPAQDYVNKTLVGSQGTELVDRILSLIGAYKTKTAIRPEPVIKEFSVSPAPKVTFFRPDMILIGASTGGTDALAHVLAHMPPDSPPVLCVQHIPAEFALAFQKRLATISGLKIGTIGKGQALLPGHLYMPVSDAHLGIKRQGDQVIPYLSNEDRIAGHRPSVDYLFRSASMLRDKKILGCLLTGMGRDGARGLLALRQNGAITLAQDEMSSVVWGMPGEAVKIGAAMLTGNLREIEGWIHAAIKSEASQRALLKRRAS